MSKSKKNLKPLKEKGLLIFVEGETEEVFFKKLIDYLKKKNPTLTPRYYNVRNLRSVTNYNKADNIFKKEILVKKDLDYIIICSYDTDVFKYRAKPPIDWPKLEVNLKELGALDVLYVPAERTIEDWFMIDFNGVYDYLKTPQKNRKKSLSAINASTGLEKIKKIFKENNKIYQKGKYVHKFLDYISMDKIYNSLPNSIKKIEDNLFK